METILLIEHNTSIRENMSEYFGLAGYKVFETDNGRDGVDIAGEYVPDLILSNLFMPGMDGFQVLRLILDNDITCKIPFIYNTTMSQKKYMVEAFEMGADYYFIKPFSMEKLMDVIKTSIKCDSRRCRKDYVPEAFVHF